MRKENEPGCEEQDYLNHFLVEQINRITVEEQEEQMKEELRHNNLN